MATVEERQRDDSGVDGSSSEVGISAGRQLTERLRRLAARIPQPVWPALLGGCLFGYLAVTAIGQWRTGRAGPDLAYFTEALTHISRGESPFLSLYGLHLLGDHTNLFLWTLGPFAAVFPVIPVLLIGQAAAASIAIWPLWLVLTRRLELSFGFAMCLLGAYALHPSIQNANMAGFHLDSFAVPFLAGAVYFALIGGQLFPGCIGSAWRAHCQRARKSPSSLSF